MYLRTFLYNGIEVEEGINSRICEINEIMNVGDSFVHLQILKIGYFRRWIDCDISTSDTKLLESACVRPSIAG